MKKVMLLFLILFAVSEYVVDGECGYLYDGHSSTDVTNAVRRALDRSPDEIHRMKEQAIARAESFDSRLVNQRLARKL